MKPRIGLTPSPTQDTLAHATLNRYAIAEPYVCAVLASEGVPTVLPPQTGNASALLDGIDGLLLTGGADIDPVRYGDQSLHPDTYGVSQLRDDFEFELLQAALTRDLPVLAICRGIQVLNVALGGTLIQHIPDCQPESNVLPHRQHQAGLAADDIGHEVSIAPGSLLATVFGEASACGVNSFHHQSILEPGAGLHIVATADDGIIEAAEVPDRRFVLGVQWHPELMFRRHSAQLRPFAALVEAAAAYRLLPSPP